MKVLYVTQAITTLCYSTMTLFLAGIFAESRRVNDLLYNLTNNVVSLTLWHCESRFHSISYVPCSKADHFPTSYNVTYYFL